MDKNCWFGLFFTPTKQPKRGWLVNSSPPKKRYPIQTKTTLCGVLGGRWWWWCVFSPKKSTAKSPNLPKFILKRTIFSCRIPWREPACWPSVWLACLGSLDVGETLEGVTARLTWLMAKLRRSPVEVGSFYPTIYRVLYIPVSGCLGFWTINSMVDALKFEQPG